MKYPRYLQDLVTPPPRTTYTAPAPSIYYTVSAKFKYPSWRRIEDTRTIYSLSGVKLSEAKKYRVELTKYLEKPEDQAEAIKELIHATVEYGFVAPEPCTERWIDTTNEELILLQNLRCNLFNLFLEHDLLEHREKDERDLVWAYIDAASDTIEQAITLVEELMKEYEYGMFSTTSKARYKTYTNKRTKKRTTPEVKSDAILH